MVKEIDEIGWGRRMVKEIVKEVACTAREHVCMVPADLLRM